MSGRGGRRSRRPWNDDDLDSLEARVTDLEDSLKDLADVDQDGDVDESDTLLKAELLSLLRHARESKQKGGE